MDNLTTQGPDKHFMYNVEYIHQYIEHSGVPMDNEIPVKLINQASDQ